MSLYLEKSIKPFYLDLMIIGILSSMMVLFANQLFPSLVNSLTPASFLSPSGGKALIFGIHLKHWITGLLLVITSLILFKNKKYPRFYSFLLGFGSFLVIDEIDDIIGFIMTGSL
jgi:hypothetical protein